MNSCVPRLIVVFHLIACLIVSPLLAADDDAAGDPDQPGQVATLLEVFLQKSTPENYQKLRNAVVADKAYDPYSDDLDRMETYYAERKYADVRKQYEATFPNLLLSPRAHDLLSRVSLHLRDGERLTTERTLSDKCLQGIVATGNGSRGKPYVVSRASDEYDVIAHLNKDVSSQGLIFGGDRNLDLLQCRDGTQVYFDITDVFSQLQKRLDGPEK